jgi:hypothetical protein
MPQEPPPHTVVLLPLRIVPALRPEAITGRGDPRGMLPVQQTGAEVSKTFWAKLTGRRGAGWAGSVLRAMLHQP